MAGGAFVKLCKWVKFESRNLEKVQRRLHTLLKAEIPGIPKLLNYGFTDSRVRLELKWVDGETLYAMHPNRKRVATRINALADYLIQWKKLGFVHGDLSPRNIVIGKQSLWCVDWLVDINSFAGTPAFASPKILKTGHTHETDLYAFRQILSTIDV